MDQAEVERRHSEKKYATVIFVPHGSARFRKLKISHRLIFSFLSVVVSALCLQTFFAVLYLNSLGDQVYARRASTADLERELVQANQQVARSFHHLDLLTRTVLEEQRNREAQLRELQARYDTIRALTAGQERIAEAHRAILTQRSTADRLIEIGLGFSVGVLSSLAATALWWVFHRSTPLTATQVDELRIDE